MGLVCVCVASSVAHAGSAVVTNGRFTNIYVYPDPDKETWEQHIAKLRPDADQFSRAKIDKWTQDLMAPVWPSYFDALMQYNGIHPPRFFGSAPVTQKCIDAAMKDLYKGVMQWDTIRSLSNCHENGHDPSPQINLIFSPDIKVAKITVHGGDMCTETGSHPVAWHAWGINTPNFVAMPTSTQCFGNLASFEQTFSHEIVETISDPAGMGMGDFGSNELGDNCENRPDADTTWNGLPVARYWSNFDRACVPRLDPPAGSTSTTWVLAESSPIKRLTGDVHSVSLGVPGNRPVADVPATQVMIVVQTGGDDLRGGSNPNDNADVTLSFAGGSKITKNINQGRSWENGETHAFKLELPTPAPKVKDITGVTITTHFGGGIGGDNWNIDKVALVVSFQADAPTHGPTPIVVHDWLDASGAPLIRFTGDRHDLSLTVKPDDAGKQVSALDVIISTGNDDLRGGNDNCDVTVTLASGKTITVNDANRGANWKNWTDHTVSIPIAGVPIKGGDVKSVSIHTAFGGGIGGDNWNVNRVRLRATLK